VRSQEEQTISLTPAGLPILSVSLSMTTDRTEAGAIIFPITPTFYNRQSTVESIVEEFAHRVLTIIGLKQTNKYEWNGTSTETRKIHTAYTMLYNTLLEEELAKVSPLE
jgi:4-hydroxy-3-polyprenylbenzoate decarboxylase